MARRCIINLKYIIMRKLLTLTLVFFALTLTSCIEEAKGEVKAVSAEEMQTLLELDDVQLVDVRTAAEHSEGYIAKAQNIDFSSPTFDKDITRLDKEKPVVLYCKSGGRSAKCAQKMKDAGFVKIYDLEGGISKWKHKGFEVKKKSS